MTIQASTMSLGVDRVVERVRSRPVYWSYMMATQDTKLQYHVAAKLDPAGGFDSRLPWTKYLLHGWNVSVTGLGHCKLLAGDEVLDISSNIFRLCRGSESAIKLLVHPESGGSE